MTASGSEDLAEQDLSRAEWVYARLRRGIRSGEFRPGQRLREVELAESLRVSRTPIREAIRRLASDGLVEGAPSRGVMITQLGKQQVRELYAFREALEGTAASLAAQHVSPAAIALMHDVLDAESVAHEALEIARLNRLFHETVREAAQNRYLNQALAQLSDSLALLPGTTFEVPGRADGARREHRLILTAIESRNAEEADRLARQHIAAAGAARLRMMFGVG